MKCIGRVGRYFQIVNFQSASITRTGEKLLHLELVPNDESVTIFYEGKRNVNRFSKTFNSTQFVYINSEHVILRHFSKKSHFSPIIGKVQVIVVIKKISVFITQIGQKADYDLQRSLLLGRATIACIVAPTLQQSLMPSMHVATVEGKTAL